MTTQDLKKRLTIDDYITILNDLNAIISANNTDYIICNTICHGGNSQKLYLYKDTLLFKCYSDCGIMDIFTLLNNINDFSIVESINYICNLCNINRNNIICDYGTFGEITKIDDWEFIKRFKKYDLNKNINNATNFKVYNRDIFKIFDKFIFYDGWIKEFITIETMIKYEIMYHTLNHQVIIPHYDANNNLIGIRCRNLLDENIDLLGKYIPVKIGEVVYAHSLGKTFYGLNKNLETIKRKRKIMLVESEKSILQCDSYFNKDNFTLAICGYSITKNQIEILKNLGPLEVIIALDKQYEKPLSDEYNAHLNHIKKKFIDPLSPYMNVFIIWDNFDELKYKQSPTDLGKNKLLKLMKNKLSL